MKTIFGAAAGLALMFGAANTASAYVVYGNSAASGSNPIHYIDSTTGVEFNRIVPTPNGNGRGVVTVGNVLYYTIVGDPNIYKMDRTTGAPLGSILTTNASMSTIAFDGTNFWTADYSGSNQAFLVDATTGLNIATISLANAQNYMDGLEFFNGKLIGNRCDACGVYDIYDLSGNVLSAAFITAPGAATGIAFDGTNFLVSNIFASSIGVYSGTTGALLSTLNLTSSSGSFLIEDLSVDYASRPDTCGGPNQPPCDHNVPEPASLTILGLGLLGLAATRRHRRG